jgi:hypothetical protein
MLGDEMDLRMNLMFLLSPPNFVFVCAGTVLGHALIFSHKLPSKDGSPLPFIRASALALVYVGISSAFAIFAYVIVSVAYIALRA